MEVSCRQDHRSQPAIPNGFAGWPTASPPGSSCGSSPDAPGTAAALSSLTCPAVPVLRVLGQVNCFRPTVSGLW